MFAVKKLALRWESMNSGFFSDIEKTVRGSLMFNFFQPFLDTFWHQHYDLLLTTMAVYHSLPCYNGTCCILCFSLCCTYLIQLSLCMIHYHLRNKDLFWICIKWRLEMCDIRQKWTKLWDFWDKRTAMPAETWRHLWHCHDRQYINFHSYNSNCLLTFDFDIVSLGSNQHQLPS